MLGFISIFNGYRQIYEECKMFEITHTFIYLHEIQLLTIIRYCLYYGFFLGFSLSVVAQADTSHAVQDTLRTDTLVRYRMNGQYLMSMVTDVGYVASRPAHWKSRDFVRLGTVLGGAALLMAGDYEIKRLLQRNRHSAMDDVSKVVEPFGNAYSPYLVAGMYVASVVTHQRGLEHASLMTAKSLAISTLFYTATKVVIRRERPSYTNSPFSYDPPFTGDKPHTSMPSGHMLTVMTVATSLSEAYGKDYPWVPWVAYSIAGLTGLSRLYDNRHWSSDVWIGASLGFFVTKAIYRRHRMLEQKKRERLNLD